jgi:hypothetical protein
MHYEIINCGVGFQNGMLAIPIPKSKCSGSLFAMLLKSFPSSIENAPGSYNFLGAPSAEATSVAPANCKLLKRIGERGRNRTFNLLIKSQLLCQLSYAPLLWKSIR